jgi:maltose phosphorylase
MNEPIDNREWALVENGFHPEYNILTEGLMGIANGYASQRANFEERFTGETIQGNYLNGITHPETIHLGKCKKEIPEIPEGYINAADWRGIDVRIGAEILDLNNVNILDFKRILNLQTSVLYRSFIVELTSGKRLKVETHRFLSIVDPEIGAIKYTVTALNFSDKITLIPFIGFETRENDEKKDGKFWDEVAIDVVPGEGYLIAEVCKSLCQVCIGMKINILRNGIQSEYPADVENRHKYIANIISLMVTEGESVTIEKFGINALSQNYPEGQLMENAKVHLNTAFQKGFDQLEKEHVEANIERWKTIEQMNGTDLAKQLQSRFDQFRQFQKFPKEVAVSIEDELPEWLM